MEKTLGVLLSGEKEYFHQDFSKIEEKIKENASSKAILFRGKHETGKTTMIHQLGHRMGKKPRIYDLSNSSVNGEAYFDQQLVLLDLKQHQETGGLVVVEHFDQLDMYDNYLLMGYFFNMMKNPNSTILLIENTEHSNFITGHERIKDSFCSVTLSVDPYIEEKIRLKKEEEEKQKNSSNKVKVYSSIF